MAKETLNFGVVREIARTMSDIEVDTIRGATSLRTHGKLLACQAVHKSAEPNTLVVRLDFDRRKELIEAEPRIYYVTEHYLNYPSVLVRLSEIDRESLKDLLGMALRYVTSKSKPRGRNASNLKRSAKAR